MEEDSYFEQNVNTVLTKLEFSFTWNGSKNINNPQRFPVGININDDYTPDFILNRSINNKQIIIETHKNELFNKDELRRLETFKKFNPRYYFIIITNEGDTLRSLLRQKRMSKNAICDNLWIEPDKATERQKRKTKRDAQNILFWSSGTRYLPDGRKLNNLVPPPFVTDPRKLFLMSKFTKLRNRSKPMDGRYNEKNRRC